MLAYIVRRLLQSILVLIAVGFIAFSLFNFVGDPINNMVGVEATDAERDAARQRLGLDDPFPVQFARFVANAVQGDFGQSYRLSIPVETAIAERLPATLELVFVAAVLALAIGVPLGVYTGLHRDGAISRLLLTASLIGISLPTFLIGILLILIFSVWLGWLPSFGRGATVDLWGWESNLVTWEGFKSIILPSVTLCLFQLTLLMRLVRAEMLEVLRTDYVKFARARGLTNRAIHFRHALRNTLVPVITITGLQIGSLIAFAIITETVFQWPGMGLLFLQAIQFVDIPVMAAYLCLVAFIFVVINLVVDLLYYAIDPRLRLDRAGHAHRGRGNGIDYQRRANEYERGEASSRSLAAVFRQRPFLQLSSFTGDPYCLRDDVDHFHRCVWRADAGAVQYQRRCDTRFDGCVLTASLD